MDKISAEYAPETPTYDTGDIDSRYSCACIMDELPGESLPRSYASREISEVTRGSVNRYMQPEQKGDTASFVKQMFEFVKRIEDSAESSLVWGRIGGSELTRLRRHFNELLEQVLDEVDQDAPELREVYETVSTSERNGDILQAYRLACLLAAAVKASYGQAVSRVEVGCGSKNREFACFLGEQSAGVTLRKKDNLFALCSSGSWHTGLPSWTPLLTSIQRIIESCGGILQVDAMDGIKVRASFPAKA